jgi:hypothetical protein
MDIKNVRIYLQDQYLYGILLNLYYPVKVKLTFLNKAIYKKFSIKSNFSKIIQGTILMKKYPKVQLFCVLVLIQSLIFCFALIMPKSAIAQQGTEKGASVMLAPSLHLNIPQFVNNPLISNIKKTKIATINGSNGSFYVLSEEYKKIIESIQEGDTVIIGAPGGGGDAKGSISFIMDLKKILQAQAKDTDKICFILISSNIKYGKENPWSGTVKVDYIEGLKPVIVNGNEKSHFYKIEGNVKINIPITNTDGDPIMLNDVPLIYKEVWSEGEVADVVAREGIELYIMDLDQPASILRDSFKVWTAEIENYTGGKTHSFFKDMGGDCFIKVPEKLNRHDQLEVNIASPVSDITGLLIFDDYPALVTALGGDGEMRWAIPKYLPEYFANDEIVAIFDNLLFSQQNPEHFYHKQKVVDVIRSEVSTNHGYRIDQGIQQNWVSLLRVFGPWNHKILLKRIRDIETEHKSVGREELKDKAIRYESRKEFNTGYYLPTIVVRSTKDITNKVINKSILDPDMNWLERNEEFIKWGYLTERSSAILYRSQIKYLTRTLLELLDKYSSQGEICESAIIDLVFKDKIPITLKLAAIRAIYQHRSNFDEEYNQQFRDEVLGLLERDDFEIFLISEVVKTLGITGATDEECIEQLFSFLVDIAGMRISQYFRNTLDEYFLLAPENGNTVKQIDRAWVSMLMQQVINSLGIASTDNKFRDDLIARIKDPSYRGSWPFYSPYIEKYAFQRAKSVAERTLFALIQKQLYSQGYSVAKAYYQRWEKAWEIYSRSFGDKSVHPNFKILKALITLSEIEGKLEYRGISMAEQMIIEAENESLFDVEDKEVLKRLKELKKQISERKETADKIRQGMLDRRGIGDGIISNSQGNGYIAIPQVIGCSI